MKLVNAKLYEEQIKRKMWEVWYDEMRIDLPQCGFKNCKFQADGNCLQKSEYDRCEHKSAISTINSIIMACNLCCLCQNTACQNTGKEEYGCVPIWNGLGFGAR